MSEVLYDAPPRPPVRALHYRPKGDGRRLEMTVTPALAVSRCLGAGEFDAVISVMGEAELLPSSAIPAVAVLPQALHRPRLHLPLADINSPPRPGEVAILALAGQPRRAPDTTDVAKLVAFIRPMLQLAAFRGPDAAVRVLVHCGSGLTRSPAVAIVLAALDDGPGHEVASVRAILAAVPDARPNLALIRAADAVLDRNGALLRAVLETFK